MRSFAQKIKELRERKSDPLRLVAAFLNIDQAILSKIENGKRKASRDNVIKLAKYFGVGEEELLILWLSDIIVYEIADEDIAVEALKLAEKKVQYIRDPNRK